jgi:hypothetical protein
MLLQRLKHREYLGLAENKSKALPIKGAHLKNLFKKARIWP